MKVENDHLGKVKKYYDNNTSKFMKFGVDASNFNIHQPLWGPGVKSYDQACQYSNSLILDECKDIKIPSPSILDLGCGLGSSLNFLSDHFHEAQYYGLTISQKQKKLADDIISKTHGKEYIKIVCGDFHKTTDHFHNIDLAFSIEAMVHSSDLEVFFRENAKVLSRGARLVIIDDIASDDRCNVHKTIFHKNWLLESLKSEEKISAIAQKNGLKLMKSISLDDFIRNSFRNKFLRLLYPMLRIWPFKGNYIMAVLGGIARQICLKRNIISYKMLVFEKI